MVLWRSCPSVRSATLTIVVSRIDMIIPRMTTPAIFHTYGSMRSDASGWKPGSVVVVGREDIRYLNVRNRSFLLQGVWRDFLATLPQTVSALERSSGLSQ